MQQVARGASSIVSASSPRTSSDVERFLKPSDTVAGPPEIRPNFVPAFAKDPNGIWIELCQQRAWSRETVPIP